MSSRGWFEVYTRDLNEAELTKREEAFAIRRRDRVPSGQVLTKVWGKAAPRSIY